MVFFLNADKKIYARYGGRDAENADHRQSLKGLNYTMQSVLRMHESEEKVFAPKSADAPKFTKDLGGRGFFGRGCMHCHNVKEALNAELRKSGKWSRDLIWRYPLPENVGIELDTDRGGAVKQVTSKSPAAKAGLQKGDIVERLHGVPIHSLADAQYALDRAPKEGAIEATWQHDGDTHTEKLALAEGWRKTDIAWRPSLQDLVPAARLDGADLTADEKKALGLSPKQLAFRQKDKVPKQAADAGIRAGDIILGVDDESLEMDSVQFVRHIRHNYLVGDRVAVNFLRDGKAEKRTMTLAR